METPVAGRHAGVLERVDHAWSLYRRHLGAFAAIGLVTNGLVLLLAMVLTGSGATIREAAAIVAGHWPLPLFGYGAVPALWIVGLLAAAWEIASLLTYTRLAYMGQPLSVRQALLAGVKDIWRTSLIVLAIAAIAFGIILAYALFVRMIGILAPLVLMPLFVYIMVRYSLAVPAHLYERSSLKMSLQRGWDLAGMRIWHAMGFYLLIYLITFGLMMLISLAAAPLVAGVADETTKTAPSVWLILVYLLVLAPILMTISNWIIVASGLLFLELRDEQEGRDLWQKLREIEESRGMPTSLPQPLSPPPPER